MKVEQEEDRIDAPRVHRATVVGFVGLVLGIGAAILLMRGTPANVTPPVASAFINTQEPGIALREEKRRSLDQYGWVDRDAGIARIPIERAMDLVAADGGAP